MDEVRLLEDLLGAELVRPCEMMRLTIILAGESFVIIGLVKNKNCGCDSRQGMLVQEHKLNFLKAKA